VEVNAHLLVGPGDDVLVSDVGDLLLDSQVLQNLQHIPMGTQTQKKCLVECRGGGCIHAHINRTD
jgi:hypothetical protein